MGTNYYATIPADCNNPAHGEELHIGKKSAGWKFSHRAYLDRPYPLNCWAEWLLLLKQDGVVIKNEYGVILTLEEMQEVVDIRTPYGPDERPIICHIDPTPQMVEDSFGGRPPVRSIREFHDPEDRDFYDGEFC